MIKMGNEKNDSEKGYDKGYQAGKEAAEKNED